MSVKFEIQFSDFDSNPAINTLVDLFKNHRCFYDLSLSNIHEKYLNLLQDFKRTDELYIYQYNEFSSNFLNLYNIENIKKSSNTAIKIVSGNNVLNKIIKSSLYSNLYSNNFFFYNIVEDTDNILDYIVNNNRTIFNNKKHDFIEIIGVLENYILKSSIRSVIFFIDRILNIEEENFFKYLLNMTKIKNIVLVSFNIDIGCVFDVEFNEFPENYFYNKTLFESKKKNNFEDLNKQIKKKLDNIHCIDEVIDFNNNSVSNLLKIAEMYRKSKDYNNLFKTLERFPKDIPDEYKSHYYYLNYYYKDRFMSPVIAEGFYKKIREPYFINLANLHKSDRLMKNGELNDAIAILLDSKKFFNKNEYKFEELEADGQIAKYYSVSGNKIKSENIYKNSFFYAEINDFMFLSASLSLDLGNLYYSIDDFNQAGFWYEKSLNIYENLKNKNGINLCEFNLSEIYKINGEWNKSKVLLMKALVNDKKDNRKESIATDCYNIAHLEYLKNCINESAKYCSLAIKNFDELKIINALIDSKLLSFRINFSSFSNKEILEFEQKYFEKCSDNQKTMFLILKDTLNNMKTKVIIEKLNNFTSKYIRFEMLVFLIHQSNNENYFSLLKQVTALISKKKRDYFFYEYQYLYFNYFFKKDTITEKDKELFLEVFYYFLKNKRIIANNMLKIKKIIEKDNVFNDLLDNARVVDGYKNWKTPDDFFISFSNEIEKSLKVDFLYMKIYLDKKQLFEFSNIKTYLEIAGEMVDVSVKELSPITLLVDDIKKMKSKEKLFYPYTVTKIIPWKISEKIFSVLIFGFSNNYNANLDVFAESRVLLVKYGSLFSAFYSKQFVDREKLNFIIGSSGSIEDIKKRIIKLGSSDLSILIFGESGTGKELIAKALHNLSYRYNKPFVPVNISAIPESLLEAELFGTRKGAFTGANEDRMGLIESADKGTLFLDEIGEIPISLQAKLLRTLDSGEVRRLGENKIKIVDLHIVSATNKNLKEMVGRGEFREDLYYRINEIEIKSPPLRERMSDIPVLTEHFLKKHRFVVEDENEKQNIINYLMKFNYSGNIRELESKIKTLITFYPDYDENEALSNDRYTTEMGLFELRDNYEKSIIIKSLKENKNIKQTTAESLKISRMYLATLIKKYDIS